MVNAETPAVCDRFKVDLGGHEIDHFYQVDLPDLDIPVVEHNSGDSGKRYPTKHAEYPDYGGTFTASLYARGEKNAIDEWWDTITSWEEGENEEAISISAYAPDEERIGRWEFEDAKLIKYQYDDSLSGGEAMKITITVSYRKMERKEP